MVSLSQGRGKAKAAAAAAPSATPAKAIKDSVRAAAAALAIAVRALRNAYSCCCSSDGPRQHMCYIFQKKSQLTIISRAREFSTRVLPPPTPSIHPRDLRGRRRWWASPAVL